MSASLLRDTHHCDVCLLTCMDFRMWERVARLVRTECGVDCCDLVAAPGAAKKILEEATREDILGSFSIAANLHGVKTIVLVNHEDCGAYGGSKKFSDRDSERHFHEEALRESARIVEERLPNVSVKLFYAHFTPDGSNIALARVAKKDQ